MKLLQDFPDNPKGDAARKAYSEASDLLNVSEATRAAYREIKTQIDIINDELSDKDSNELIHSGSGRVITNSERNNLNVSVSEAAVTAAAPSATTEPAASAPSAGYVQAEATEVRDLANELKTIVDALVLWVSEINTRLEG